jgi:hypothetical protein
LSTVLEAVGVAGRLAVTDRLGVVAVDGVLLTLVVTLPAGLVAEAGVLALVAGCESTLDVGSGTGWAASVQPARAPRVRATAGMAIRLTSHRRRPS